MEKFIILIWFEFIFWAAVFIAIIVDLISGVRKAMKAGIARTSYGYRRTVDKILRYYGTLILLCVGDAMQVLVIFHYKWSDTLFPWITFLYSFSLILIEIKSVFEKSEDKARFQSLGKTLGTILTNPTDYKKAAEAALDWMNRPDTPNDAKIEIKIKDNETITNIR